MNDFKALIGIQLPLILASQSPRRKHLLEMLGLEFTVFPADIDETNHKGLSPEELARLLAEEKALAIARIVKEESLVIGSDTIVVLDDIMLGKPSNNAEAKLMLRTLSGNTHSVLSGISIVNSKTLHTKSAVQKTKVTFRELTDEEIDFYVAGGSPMDKAGAYGIQDDMGAVFVSKVEGCYYNIVGLPLELLYRKLKEFCNEE